MSELLALPLKKSSDVEVVKPLVNYLTSAYDASDEHAAAAGELARLRTAAIWKIFDSTDLELLYSYYDQLASLESKIPPQEVQIPFKWKDAFDKGSIFGGRMSLTISSLAYERVCILYNMAAMQSRVAIAQAPDTDEALKLAAKLFQQSSGILNYLKSNVMMAVHQETTPDLSPETLGALQQLMLAQAQEVIVLKCIKDEMKEGMVAKVAAKCEELYTDVLRAFQKETLKPLWEREWIPTVSAKQAAYSGLAQYYQSLVCKANKSVGEEISRLQVAVEQFKQAQSRLGQPSFFQEQLARAQRNLKEALKDNDFIYHERVPDAKQLEPIARVQVAKPLPLQEKWGASHKDLFAALVPVAVHQAQTASDARRSETVTSEINKLRESTQLLNGLLSSLNLPAAIEQVRGEGLPQSIREKAAAVREAGGVEGLRRLMTELPELLQRNREILEEADRMLREEAESDASLRQQFGARWTRTESAKLTETFVANATKYRQIIDNAVRADSIVRQKFEQHREGIELLSRSDGEITAGVPSAPSGGVQESGAVRALRKLMEDVETIKAERDVIESELKCATVDMRAKFLEALNKDGAIDEPALSAEALGAALGPLSRQARESLQRQEELVRQIQAAHGEFTSERGASAGGRDGALGSLCAAHDAYQELSNNLNEGVKFYNDLTQLLVAFQNKVSDFCFARKTEKEELMKDLTQQASRGPSGPAPAPPTCEQPVAKKEAPPRPPPPTPAGSAPTPAAAAAPLPYPTQPQGMPLPYAPPGAVPYPYYQPPMPAAYNPYATMPYPRSQGYQIFPPAPQYQGYQYPQGSQYPQQPPGYNPYQQQ